MDITPQNMPLCFICPNVLPYVPLRAPTYPLHALHKLININF